MEPENNDVECEICHEYLNSVQLGINRKAQATERMWKIMRKLARLDMEQRYDEDGMDIYGEILALIDDYYGQIEEK